MTSSGQTSTETHIINFEHRPDHLFVVIKAAWLELEEVLSIWRRVAEECLESDCDKILVHRDIPKLLPLETIFWIRSEFPKMGFPLCRIAIVDPHPQNAETNNFADTVAQNRGVESRTFMTAEEAEEWLFGK